jgi:hypothetical protein
VISTLRSSSRRRTVAPMIDEIVYKVDVVWVCRRMVIITVTRPRRGPALAGSSDSDSKREGTGA